LIPHAAVALLLLVGCIILLIFLHLLRHSAIIGSLLGVPRLSQQLLSLPQNPSNQSSPLLLLLLLLLLVPARCELVGVDFCDCRMFLVAL
jgi:hypothetical protein